MKDAAAGNSSASDSDLTSLGPRSSGNNHQHHHHHQQHHHAVGTSGNGNGSSNGSDRSSGTQVAGNGATTGQQQAKDIAGSRQSFKIAMGNPCEMFVDVM